MLAQAVSAQAVSVRARARAPGPCRCRWRRALQPIVILLRRIQFSVEYSLQVAYYRIGCTRKDAGGGAAPPASTRKDAGGAGAAGIGLLGCGPAAAWGDAAVLWRSAASLTGGTLSGPEARAPARRYWAQPRHRKSGARGRRPPGRRRRGCGELGGLLRCGAGALSRLARGSLRGWRS